ncbi:MAG: addiction module protein [Verrucomicrobia bacterium]|nr:addiction module protein [Verrucomicrobiota bacterium]
MSKTFEEISRYSLQLPRNQRLALARFLLDLDNPSDDPEVEDLWHSEILKRARAVELGTTQGLAYGEVLGKVDAAINR